MTFVKGQKLGGLGINPTIKRRRKTLEDHREKIFALREQGMGVAEISSTLHIKEREISKILFNGVYKAERIAKMNEMLLSMAPRARAVIAERLEKGDESVAMWLLEKVGIVGKEQVNLTINATNAQVNLSNDTLEAARAVAAAMRAAPVRALPPPPPDFIEADVIETEEEKINDGLLPSSADSIESPAVDPNSSSVG